MFDEQKESGLEDLVREAVANALKEKSEKKDKPSTRCSDAPSCKALWGRDGVKIIVGHITSADMNAKTITIVKVYKRSKDDTYWRATYTASVNDRNKNGLKNNQAEIVQVFPGEQKMRVFKTRDAGTPWEPVV